MYVCEYVHIVSIKINFLILYFVYMHAYTHSVNNGCMYYSEYLEMSVYKCLHNVFW